jgi:hypothetical protein
MRTIAMLAMAAVGMSARAEQRVTVYVQDGSVIPNLVLIQARDMAAKMFTEAGVRIDWVINRTSGAHSQGERAISVSMAAHTPADYLPGAMASAKAYEGVHITVFWDRIEHPARPAPAAVVLAHVLVHEVTHILQGIDRHSESGIMKAGWTHSDYAAMALKPLPFTPHDILLMHIGREE